MTYNIDEIDKRILFELDKNSRIADTSIAKKIGKSKEAVRYRIKKLEETNIIKKYSLWIDPTKLGYQTGKIYLNLSNVPEKKKSFIEYVKNDNRLFWLGMAEGVWNAGLTYFIKDYEEFFEIKNDLFSRFKDLILDCKTANLVSVNFHDKTFLFDSETSWATMFQKREENKLDEISKKILKSLFNNSRENIASIAIENKTTVDIVRNRMKRMEEMGIIKRYTILVDYQKIGYEFYKTFLYFKSLDKINTEKIMKYVNNSKNIVHLVKQISPWDIELESFCLSFSDYNKIINELTQKFSDNIQKVETAIMTHDIVFPSNKLIFE